jgi:S1-C subfamily serine protease
MSERQRFPMIAMGFAVVALITAFAAVIVVVRRGATPPPAAAEAPVGERRVAATDVVKLHRNGVDLVVEGGQPRGVRVKDPELARTLGLAPGDVITAMSGRPIVREFDVYEAVFNTGMMGATTLYIELIHDKKPTLVRWKLDGDLRSARYSFDAFGSAPPSVATAAASVVPPDPDPLLDTIEKVDDTHVTVPRAIIDKLLANPMSFATSVRAVPAVKNGKPDGFKLYAIRPSSLFARLGFENGDTINAINGHELTSADKVLETYTKLRTASELAIDLTRRGHNMSLEISIK